MGRKTYLPYYCKNNPSNTQINNNTITTINGMDLKNLNDEQYADGGDESSKWFTGDELTRWEKSCLAPVQFKLLIPPISGNSNTPQVSLKYTFGKNINSVTTFYRSADLSGVYYPLGDTNQFAVRDSENITLTWTANMVDYKTFKLLDVASGSKKHSVSMSVVNDAKLQNYFTSLSDTNENVDYDLSTNVVQIYLVSSDYQLDINDPNFKKTDAVKKLLILSTTESQYYTIKMTPETFVPYRYYNGEINNLFVIFNNENNKSFNPLSPSTIGFTPEVFFFNPSKYTTKGENNGYINGTNTNAKIINPEQQNLFAASHKTTGFNGITVTANQDISFNIVFSGDIETRTLPVILNRFKSTDSVNSSLTIQPYLPDIYRRIIHSL